MKTSGVLLTATIATAVLLVGGAAGAPPQLPSSATAQDITADDPVGLGRLKALLGNPAQYFPPYQYLKYPPGRYNVNPDMDPNNGTDGGVAADAKLGRWRLAGNTGAWAIHALPFPDGEVLFYQRPSTFNGSVINPSLKINATDGSTRVEIASLYNLKTAAFKPYHITLNPFCNAHALLPDGRGILVGGDNLNPNPPHLLVGFQAVQVFDPATQQLETVAWLQRARWYASVATLADGNLLVVGGMQQEAGGFASTPAPSNEFTPRVTCSRNAPGSNDDPGFDNPTYNIINTTDFSQSPALALRILLDAWPVGSYPFVTQLPSGAVLIVAGQEMQALFFSPGGARNDTATGLLPTLPTGVNYPSYGSMALLDLAPPAYTAQVLIAGGGGLPCPNAMTPASKSSFLINVAPGADHSIRKESMKYRRVMGDLVNLPDGRVFLCNGAQVGLGGGAGVGAGNAFNGSTVAEIYDPSKPVGQRWSAVADSKIWRLYHSVAFLTRNAEVFVAGSEVTAERRAQVYTPDYLLSGRPRPRLTQAPRTVGYGATFMLGFGGVPTLDRVVLTRLAGSTHGNHFDQRQVVLACDAVSSALVRCTAPPNGNVAPPGVYMLFGLLRGTPSVAKLVMLR